MEKSVSRNFDAVSQSLNSGGHVKVLRHRWVCGKRAQFEQSRHTLRLVDFTNPWRRTTSLARRVTLRSVCEKIVDCVLNDKKLVLPVSVRVPGRNCCLSLPVVVGITGVESILDVVSHLSPVEKEMYDASVDRMEQAVAVLGECV